MSHVALTFDDGPDPVCTPPLLDLLAGHGVSATFFPIAPRAATHPDLISRMLAEGHTVGLHCERHIRHGERDIAAGEADTACAMDRLHALGARPYLWRTPWGEQSDWTRDVADRWGLRLVGWTVDTHDWRGDSAEAMFAATRPSLTPGAIVLAHDGIGPGARRQDAQSTLQYAALVIGHARRTGLSLEALN